MIFRRLMIAGSMALSIAGAIPVAHAQDIHDRTIKLGHQSPADAPLSTASKKFVELLSAKSGGLLKIRHFPASQLGTEAQQLSALMGGTQEMFIPTSSSVATVVKEFGLFDFPFIFNSVAQADALLDGPVGSAFLAKLPERGLVGLGYWENGFRNLSNSVRPINKLEDFAGLKVRIIPNPIFVESFKALKMNPVPLPFGEVYGALEARAVDGQENPFGVIAASNFQEVQKYATHTNHVYSPFVVLVSKSFWEKLSVTEKRVIQEAFAEARTYQREVNRQVNASAVGQLSSKGMKINDIPPAELKRIGAAVQPVKEKFAASYDPALVRMFFSEIENLSTR